MNSMSSHAPAGRPQTVYLDLTHLGRHVTGIERIAIELFEKQTFDGAVLKPVRSTGTVSMILMQQMWLPLLALLNPSAKFIFPGFPPSPLFVFARNRTFLYVHDLFLVTRRQDLSRNAKLYMAWPFRIAVTRLRNFMVNSEKTRAELALFMKPDASIALYRPSVRNVFDLSVQGRDSLQTVPARIRVVSVGTTTTRTLETLAGRPEGFGAGIGESSLYITPGFSFRAIDALITNFHLPRSTPLLLASAFAGRERLLSAYREAVARGYRLYSFGDATLLL